MIRIAATGHRCNKLWGYNYNDPHYRILKNIFKSHIINAINNTEDRTVECISGMALGTDTIFALAALEASLLGYNVNLVAAIPFEGQELRWPENSIKLYNHILKHASEIVYVCDKGYKPYKMQKRNEYMVNRLDSINDKLIAVWNGSNSGTANCVHYAESRGKNIIYINPNNIVLTKNLIYSVNDNSNFYL